MTIDTDSIWRQLGHDQPYWGVLANDRFLKEKLTPAVIDEFYKSGEEDIASFENTLRHYYGDDFNPETALDFGCGVGRLSLPMAVRISQVVGVDISPGMLDLARKRAAEKQASNILFCGHIPDRQFDWVNSYIVIQHIAPEGGISIIDRLAKAVRHDGFLSLHVPVYRLGTPTQGMFNYPLNEVLRVLVENGLRELHSVVIEHGTQFGLMIYSRKI